MALTSLPAVAQPVPLGEVPRPGDAARYAVDLRLTGNLIVTQDGKRQPVPLEAVARHRFADRTLAADGGMPRRSARGYAEATATATVGGDRSARALAADRRLVLADRGPDGVTCCSPAGPLTREELDLVSDHFNPQSLPGLLPGQPVRPGDTWAVGDAAAQAACQFDGLVRHTLTGKLVSATAAAAEFAVEGTAEGIEDGARVRLTVAATGTFDRAAGRVVALTWTQRDVREQGPVSPAAEVEVKITLTREVLPRPPAELADAALAGVPAGPAPPAMLHLRHADPKGRFRFLYPREWHVTGQTDAHLVLRLLDRGELVAQATVTAWKKLEPGRRVTADEFKAAVGSAPGWAAGKPLDEGEVPTDGGRWAYRVAAEGALDGVPVVRAVHVLAGPQGDHVLVTVVARPEKVRALGTRDVGLVNAVEFPGR